MSNNLFRKGLVAAAVVALGTAGLSAVPAQAASVLFAPSTGTGNTLVAGETFSLTASLSSDLPAANSTQLKFKVTNTNGVAATVKLNNLSPVASAPTETTTVTNAGTHAPNNTYATSMLPVSLDASVAGTTASSLTSTAGASSVFGVTAAITDAVTYGAADSASTGNRYAYDTYTGSTASNATNPTTIKIASTPDATADYTVTAWLDANNNGIVDSGELSAAQTVHFVKVANAGATVTFNKPSQTSAALKATVAFASDLNIAQLTAANYKFGFGVYTSAGEKAAVVSSAGTAIGAANLISASVATAGDAFLTSGSATAVNGPAGASALPVAGGTYAAQLWSRATDGTTFVAIGTEAAQVVASNDSNSIGYLAPAASANIRANGSFTATTNTSSHYVRTGTTSVSLSATVKAKTSSTDYTQVAVGAGVPVNYTVAYSTGATGIGGYTFGVSPADSTVKDTISVNGVALSGTATTNYTGTVTTDATGKISIPVVTTAGYAGDRVVITYSLPNGAILTNGSYGLTADTVITGSETLTWADATAANVTNVTNNTYVVKGGTISGTFNLSDEFAAPITTADTYQLLVYVPGAAGTTSPVAKYVYVPFVNGVAVLSTADNSTGAGSNQVTYTLQKKVAGQWTTPGSAVNAYYTVQSAAPVAVALTAVNNGSATAANNHLDTAATFANVDGRVAGATTPAADLNGSAITVSGVATDVNGVGVAGVPVTVSATGLQFKDGSVYTIGAATVLSGANGAYTVDAYSHTAGKVTFTATVGSISKTTSVTFASAADNSGKILTITAPATLTPGQTAQVSVLLTDKYGNPVAVTNLANSTPNTTDRTFKFSASTGVGSVSAAQTATGTDGTALISITTGSADNGVITLTATYDADGAYTDITGAITATATIKVAAAAAAKNTVAVAASQAQVGAAVDVTATAVDAAGKPAAGVVVSFTVAGQGYLSTASATTNAAGVATVKLVSNVAGMNTVSAAANGVATAATAAVTFGNADANITFNSNKRRATATYEFAGNAKVVISVNGVRVKTLYPADDMVGSYSVSLKKGKNKVSVSVAGVTTDSHTVTTK